MWRVIIQKIKIVALSAELCQNGRLSTWCSFLHWRYFRHLQTWFCREPTVVSTLWILCFSPLTEGREIKVKLKLGPTVFWYFVTRLDFQISPTKQLETCCPALEALQFYQGISTILSLSIGQDLFQLHHSSFAFPSICTAPPLNPGGSRNRSMSKTRCVALPMYNLTCITHGTSNMSCLELSYTGRHRHNMGKLAQICHADSKQLQ